MNGLIPVVFPAAIDHSRVHIDGMTPVSAGFCNLREQPSVVCGKSLTLDLPSQDGDSIFLDLLLK